MAFVVLDTDVASLAFRRRLPVDLVPLLVDRIWCVTYVTIGEMTQWAELRSWGARNRGALDHWLGSFVVINSSVEAARLWGTISGWGRLQGRSRPINDTWIAACCLAEDLPLATVNVKDYEDLVTEYGLDLVTSGG